MTQRCRSFWNSAGAQAPAIHQFVFGSIGFNAFAVYACFVKGRINCISFLNRTGTIMPALTFDQCVHIWVHIVCSVLLNSAQRRFILCILRIFPLLKITFYLICSNWNWSIVSLIERDSLVCAQFYNVETSTILITFFEATVTPQTYITESRNLAQTSRRQPEKPVVLQVD